jgi:hypothetical protein
MEAEEIKLFHSPKDRLRMTAGDRSYPNVKPVWASPIQRPETYLSLLDGTGNEIAMIREPKKLPLESWSAVKTELHKRYLTAVVNRIITAKEEYGATYWRVETNRGMRDFVCQNLRENALWYSETHLMLIDPDGNRYEVIDTRKLDKKSLTILHTIV